MAKIANIPGKLVPQDGYSAFARHHYRRHSMGRPDSSECYPSVLSRYSNCPYNQA